jgi:hypothetical protein
MKTKPAPSHPWVRIPLTPNARKDVGSYQEMLAAAAHRAKEFSVNLNHKKKAHDKKRH